MTGISEKPVWDGSVDTLRSCILAEHHHEPTTIQERAYVDSRYKLVVYQEDGTGGFMTSRKTRRSSITSGRSLSTPT